MAMMGGGMITPLGGAKWIQLSSDTDVSGIKDQDGAPLFYIDSDGDLHLRGSVRPV